MNSWPPKIMTNDPEPSDLAALRYIWQLVASHYGLNPASLISRCRIERLATARHVVWWMARQYTSLTSTDLGCRFKRDHGTILNGVKRITDQLTYDNDMQLVISYLKCRFEDERNNQLATAATG